MQKESPKKIPPPSSPIAIQRSNLKSFRDMSTASKMPKFINRSRNKGPYSKDGTSATEILSQIKSPKSNNFSQTQTFLHARQPLDNFSPRKV